VVIPFTYENKIVGYTCRFLDNRQPKFIRQSTWLCVWHRLTALRLEHVIVTEGIFDALSIGGVAVMHNTISDAQLD
jgi:hypothetical protein